MATVVVNRFEVEPAPPVQREAAPTEERETTGPDTKLSRYEVEKMIRVLQARAARVWAH